MDIINFEFSCQDEILILPKVYGVLDTEFRFGETFEKNYRKCRRFESGKNRNNTQSTKEYVRMNVTLM